MGDEYGLINEMFRPGGELFVFIAAFLTAMIGAFMSRRQRTAAGLYALTTFATTLTGINATVGYNVRGDDVLFTILIGVVAAGASGGCLVTVCTGVFRKPLILLWVSFAFVGLLATVHLSTAVEIFSLIVFPGTSPS